MARKKKDPNAPKGPGNVFFLYCRMERGNFKDELPTENLGEVTRLLGQKWKAMTDDEKKVKRKGWTGTVFVLICVLTSLSLFVCWMTD